MNKDQVTGVAERVVYALAMAILTKLVAKGYIDQDMAAYLAAGAVTLVGGLWAYWINRPQALMNAAVNSTPGTVIVTSAAVANTTPNDNIVSDKEAQVVSK